MRRLHDLATVVFGVVEQVLVGVHDRGEHCFDLLGRGDVFGERHGPLHWLRTRWEGFSRGGGTGAFGQAVPAAHDLRGVVQGEFSVDGELILHPWRHHRFVHSQNEHFVVGEQALVDCFAEAEAVELGAEDLDVVHGGDLRGVFLSLGFGGVVKQARGRGHVQPAAGSEEVGVMHAGEVRRIIAVQRDAGGAVRFVADHQIEWIDSVLGLGSRDRWERLVGGEDDCQPGGAFAFTHPFGQHSRVGGHRNGHVLGGVVLCSAGDLVI